MENITATSEKINSKYLYEIIFSFIKIKNLKLELFKYSKKYQKKLNIKLTDYIKEYFSSQRKVNLKPFFSFKNNFDKVEDKNILINNLDNYLKELNVNFDFIEEYVINSYENKEIKIDIYSPFYDSLLKNGTTKKNLTIKIPIEKIKNFDLKNDYISAIGKLNNSKIDDMNYPYINITYNNPNDINYLTELKLDFHKIKQLKLKDKENLKEQSEEKKGDTDNNNKILEKITYDTFYKTLFALPDIQNVLIDLNLKISEKKGYNENISIPSSFEEINNLLKILNLIKIILII